MLVPIPINFRKSEIGAVPIPINRSKAEIGAALTAFFKKENKSQGCPCQSSYKI
jgi:hypothetical protein